MPVVSTARRFASAISSSFTTSARPPVREHRLDDRDPVVGLVVEDPVGEAVRDRLPGPHELRSVSGCVAHGGAHLRRAWFCRQSLGNQLERSRKRPGALRLDGVHPRHVRQDAEGGCLGQRLRHSTRQRAAADLNDDVIESSSPGESSCHLVTERLAALDGEPVLVPLARERERTVRDRRLEAVIGRVANDALSRGHDRDLRSQLAQPVQHDRLGVGRDENQEPPAPRGSDDCGGQGSVPAAGDGERRPRAHGHAQPPDNLEMQEDPEQMACLVRAGDVARLVLHRDRRRRPDAVGERGAGANGVTDETVSVHLRDLLRRALAPARRSPCRSCPGRWRGGRSGRDRATRTKGLGSESSEGKSSLATVEDPTKHMVTAVTAARAAERVRLGGVDRRAAAAADDRARQLRRQVRAQQR